MHLIEVHLEIVSCSVENRDGFTIIDQVDHLKQKLSISPFFRIYEPLHVHIVTWLPHLILGKCVFNCGVAHTWRRTSASLNYERFPAWSQSNV